MRRIDLISTWLKDRRRTYAAGLDLFMKTATPTLLSKYGGQLSMAQNPPEFSIEFTTLINKLTEIRRNAITFPEQFPGAFEEDVACKVDVLSDKEIERLVKEKEEKRKALQEKIAAMEANKETDFASKSDVSDIQSQIDELAYQTISDMQSQIDDLSADIDDLKKPGVKFIKESSLPGDIAKKYNRIKEIVPLIASLHGELSDMSITGDERLSIAEQLCALDDEKRSLWDAIDAWSVSSGVNTAALQDAVVEKSTQAEPSSVSPEKALEAGAAIARRILQLKQNITRSQAALNVANQEGNAKNIKSAQARLDKYQAELTELQNQIKGE